MSAKILVCIPCRDRKAIVEQCVPTVKAGMERDDLLELFNDGSTEYDSQWLGFLGGIVWNSDKSLGIEEQRRSHFRLFESLNNRGSGFSHLYLTDSDAIHDPSWRSVALALQVEHHQAPICLYNTIVHANMPNNTIEDNPAANVIWRTFAPGISYLLTSEHVRKVMEQIHYVKNWDWDVPRILGHRFAVSRVSFVDHVGSGGIHHPDNEGLDGGDRALSPSPWLVEKRKEVVSALSKE